MPGFGCFLRKGEESCDVSFISKKKDLIAHTEMEFISIALSEEASFQVYSRLFKFYDEHSQLTNPYSLSSKKPDGTSNKIYSEPSKKSTSDFEIKSVSSFSPQKYSTKGKNKIKGKLPIGMKDESLEEPIINEFTIRNVMLEGDFYIFTLKSSCFYCIDKLIELRSQFPKIRFHMYYMYEYEFDYNQWKTYANSNRYFPNNGLFWLFLKDTARHKPFSDLYEIFQKSYKTFLNLNKIQGITFKQLIQNEPLSNFNSELFHLLVTKPSK